MVIIEAMSDDKQDPVDDLKQGLGLLFRAAKGAAAKLPTEKIEDVAKDAVKEVTRAFETIGHEVEKVVKGGRPGSQPPADASPEASAGPPGEAPAADAATAGEKKEEQPFDDAYAPEPPKGPRVG